MNNTETQPVTPTAKKDREYHNGQTTFRHVGRKWHFTAKDKAGLPFTAIIQFRGGFAVANRIAPLVEKDVLRSGSLGSNRANIQRLIDSAK